MEIGIGRTVENPATTALDVRTWLRIQSGVSWTAQYTEGRRIAQEMDCQVPFFALAGGEAATGSHRYGRREMEMVPDTIR